MLFCHPRRAIERRTLFLTSRLVCECALQKTIYNEKYRQLYSVARIIILLNLLCVTEEEHNKETFWGNGFCKLFCKLRLKVWGMHGRGALWSRAHTSPASHFPRCVCCSFHSRVGHNQLATDGRTPTASERFSESCTTHMTWISEELQLSRVNGKVCTPCLRCAFLRACILLPIPPNSRSILLFRWSRWDIQCYRGRET